MISFSLIIKLTLFKFLIVTRIERIGSELIKPCTCELFPNSLLECINPNLDFSSRSLKIESVQFTNVFFFPNCSVDVSQFYLSRNDIEVVNTAGQQIAAEFLPLLHKSFVNVRFIAFHDASLTKMLNVSNLIRLDHLDLSSNYITYLNDSSELNSNLAELILKDNLIEVIVRNYFRHLSRLKLLDLENNRLVSLELVFKFLPTLETKNLQFARNLLIRNKDITIDIEVYNERNLESENKVNMTRIKIDFSQIQWVIFPRVKAINAEVDVLATYHNLSEPNWHIPSYVVRYEKKAAKLSNVNISEAKNTTKIDQLLFIRFNTEPFNFNLENNEFTELPDVYLIYTIKLVNMRGNRLFHLKANKLPKWVEVLDFRENNIHFIGEDFFTPLVSLRQIWLAQNRIKWITKMHFTSAKIDVISLPFNQIMSIEEIFFNSSQPLFISEINLDNNQLESFPVVNGDVALVRLFSMANQRHYQPRSNESNRLKIRTIGLLNLSDNANENPAYDLRDVTSFGVIDLSASRINMDGLCDIFFDLDRTFTLKLFPQKPSYSCLDLNNAMFSFGENRVKIEACELNQVERSESYCFKRLKQREELESKSKSTKNKNDTPNNETTNDSYILSNLFLIIAGIMLLLSLFLVIYIYIKTTKKIY